MTPTVITDTPRPASGHGPVGVTAPSRSGQGGVVIVIPTIGRPSLRTLWDGLRGELPQICGGADYPDSGPAATGPGLRGPVRGPAGALVVIVDDRGSGRPLPLPGVTAETVRVVHSGGRGPAAARNVGWRTAVADAAGSGRPAPEWIVFLDDDVLVTPGWGAALHADLDAAGPDTGAVQARLSVPLPTDRRPTDWERGTAGLTRGSWLTADIVYRTTALRRVAGLDERFPRAFREDADLAHRVAAAGWQLTRGRRTTVHPVRPVDPWVSVRTQAGNADDALLRARYGPSWRTDLDAGPGRTPAHVATIAGAGLTLLGTLTRSPRLTWGGALAWAGLTTQFAWRRIAPGPRPGEPGWAAEAARMAVTSVVIPFAAVRHRAAGAWRHRGAPAWPLPVRAVLFDRDGTLVHDVPYNGDPAQVRLTDGAAAAVTRLRVAGLRVGMVTNQSGVARGLLRAEQVDAVNRRVGELVGGFDTVQVCPHGPADPDGTDATGCACRKPEPGLILHAASALGIHPAECVVIGDIGADVRAAIAAGAAGVLVPTAVTRPEEVDAAELVAENLFAAVDLILAGAAGHGRSTGAATAGRR